MSALPASAVSRRFVVASGLALGACAPRTADSAPTEPCPPLKSVATFPVGTCVQAARLADPAYAALEDAIGVITLFALLFLGLTFSGSI